MVFRRIWRMLRREVRNMDKKKKIITDPQGSYTGRNQDPYEQPVQDADDL